MNETETTQLDTLPEKKRRKLILRLVFALLWIVVAAAIVIAIYALGGELSPRGIRRAWGAVSGRVAEAEYTFETGFDEAFADLGGSIVAAGKSGIVVYDRDGSELSRAGVTILRPAIASCAELAVVYDIGGKILRVVRDDGTIIILTLENEVISCSVGRGGVFAVTTRDDGEYRGRALFYRLNGSTAERIYIWYSGEGYVLGASVGPNNKKLAVNTLSPRGGRVVLMNADSLELVGEYINPDGAILELSYTRTGELLARTADGIVSIGAEGGGTVIYDFTGRVLDGYSAEGDAFVALHYFEVTGEATGELVTIDEKGRQLGSMRTSRRLVWISAAGDRVAVLWNDGLEIYDRELRLVASYPDASGMVRAFARGGAAAVVMGPREGRTLIKT